MVSENEWPPEMCQHYHLWFSYFTQKCSAAVKNHHTSNISQATVIVYLAAN